LLQTTFIDYNQKWLSGLLSLATCSAAGSPATSRLRKDYLTSLRSTFANIHTLQYVQE